MALGRVRNDQKTLQFEEAIGAKHCQTQVFRCVTGSGFLGRLGIDMVLDTDAKETGLNVFGLFLAFIKRRTSLTGATIEIGIV